MIKNLAENKKVEIISFVPTAHSVDENTRACNLTDGITGNPDDRFCRDWVRFTCGLGRTLFLDLGGVFAVNGFDIGFIHDRESDAPCPENVKLLLSENGVDYYDVCTVEAPYPASFSMTARAVYRGELNSYVRARYVKVVFGVEGNAFCDELRVFGSECDGIERILSGEPYVITEKSAYASRDSLDGICDIPIMYFGKHASGICRIKREEFLPYLAYIDKNAGIVDTMFDSVLFVPHKNSPSGGAFWGDGEVTAFSDWEWLIEELFASDCNLKALDAVVQDIKSVLDMPHDYKCKVILTAPVPRISLKLFGDMNGDGIEEKLLTTDDCISAYCRFVDNVSRRFNAQCFQNIELFGWLWNSSLSRSDRDDEERFVEQCVAELHSRGYKCLMIPSDKYSNIYKAESVGFDCVTAQIAENGEKTQPNTHDAVADLSYLCKKYGFGIALNINEGIIESEYSQKHIEDFENQLRECVNNGMMNKTVHAYSQRGNLIYKCACSADKKLLDLYDKLYKFIKGTLSESDFDVACEKISVAEQIVVNEPVMEQAPEIEVEPEVIEPEVIEPEVIEPEVIEPEVIEPEVIEPEVIEQETVEFESIDPVKEPSDEPVEIDEMEIEITEDEFESESVPDLSVEVAVSVEIKTPESTLESSKSEAVEEPITEEPIKPEFCKKTKTKPKDKRTLAALSAGLAAAAIGVLYLIKKASDDK